MRWSRARGRGRRLVEQWEPTLCDRGAHVQVGKVRLAEEDRPAIQGERGGEGEGEGEGEVGLEEALVLPLGVQPRLGLG